MGTALELGSRVETRAYRRETTVKANITANGTGVSLEERRAEVREVEITLTDHAIALTDEAGTVAYGGSKIGDFDAGAIVLLGCIADLALTLSAAGVDADWNGDFGIGTTTASNNATLSGTEEDILPSTATPEAVSSATTAKGQSTATEIGSIWDGTSTAKDLYLNFLVDDADHDVTTTPTNIIVNGAIKLFYLNLGDY